MLGDADTYWNVNESIRGRLISIFSCLIAVWVGRGTYSFPRFPIDCLLVGAAAAVLPASEDFDVTADDLQELRSFLSGCPGSRAVCPPEPVPDTSAATYIPVPDSDDDL